MKIINGVGYITKKEFFKYVKEIENYQDKLIFILAYNGVATDKVKDLISIKITDVDFESGTINYANGKAMKLDSDSMDILKKAIDEKEYTRINKAGTPADTYKLNMSSEYLLRTKPLKITNDGLNHISYGGFRSRFNSLKDKIGLNEITFDSLSTSKIVEDLLEIKPNWQVREIKDYLEKNNINRSYYRIYKITLILMEEWI